MSDQSTSSRGVAALARERFEPNTATHIDPPRFRWGTRVAIPGAIVLCASAMLAMAAWKSLLPAVDVSATTVIEKTGATRVAGTAVVQAAGWIEADPYLTQVTALTNGVVAEMLVLEADSVKQGQVIARLVDDDALLALKRSEADLANAEAMLADAQARLEAAETDWANPIERERAVASGVARLDEAKAQLLQLESQISAAESEAKRLRDDYERTAPLVKTAAASQSDVDNARNRMDAQVATADALERHQAVIRAQIARQEVDLQAARDNLRLRTTERHELAASKAAVDLAEAQLAQSRAALDEAKLRVERLKVIALVDGVVVERYKEPGDKVMLTSDNMRSAIVLSLYDPQRLQARVDVALVDASLVAVGQKAEVVADVLPDVTFDAVTTRVLHMADIQKNTLQVKVAIINPSPLLRPEMLVRVKFLADEIESNKPEGATALFVPRDAVVDGHVWVVADYNGEHGVAQSRAVTASGGERDGWLQIDEGLQPGDLAITSPPSDLADGQRLRVTINTD